MDYNSITTFTEDDPALAIADVLAPHYSDWGYVTAEVLGSLASEVLTLRGLVQPQHVSGLQAGQLRMRLSHTDTSTGEYAGRRAAAWARRISMSVGSLADGVLGTPRTVLLKRTELRYDDCELSFPAMMLALFSHLAIGIVKPSWPQRAAAKYDAGYLCACKSVHLMFTITHTLSVAAGRTRESLPKWLGTMASDAVTGAEALHAIAAALSSHTVRGNSPGITRVFAAQHKRIHIHYADRFLMGVLPSLNEGVIADAAKLFYADFESLAEVSHVTPELADALGQLALLSSEDVIAEHYDEFVTSWGRALAAKRTGADTALLRLVWNGGLDDRSKRELEAPT